MKKITTALLTTAAIIALAFTAATTASAQCAGVTVFNNTNCGINFCLFDPAAVAPVCALVPPGVSFMPFPPGFNPAGVISAAGNRYGFVGPVVGAGCTQCITMQGVTPVVNGCCGVVCYDAATCTIRINPCPPPCLP